MYKKLIMAFTALTALAAFALPATASATNEPTLKEGATHVAVGSKVVGTNVGNTIFWNTSTTNEQVVCNSAVMKGKVLTNSGDSVVGTIESAHFTGTGDGNDCTGFTDVMVTVTTPLCLRSTAAMVTHEFQVEGNDCKAGEDPRVSFTFDVTGIGSCHYTTGSAVKGDYTTGGTAALLTTRDTSAGSGASKTSGSFLCPSSGMMQMTFELETENSTKLQVVDTTP